MKKIFALVAFFAGLIWSQFPAVSPYLGVQRFGFETVLEANGVVVIGTGATGIQYKTSIRLDGASGHVHDGDSSVVSFVTGAHGPVNCNTLGDTLCERHRAYTIQGFRLDIGGVVSGVLLPSPFWTQFWYRVSNLTLTNHHTPDTGEGDWESPATWCQDTSTSCNNPITITRDSAGYIHWVQSSSVTYQASLSTDPLGRAQIKQNEWVLIQCFIKNTAVGGYAMVWVTTPRGRFLHSVATLSNQHGQLAYFHAGLYCSPAVAHGSVSNDELLIAPVPDTSYAFNRYMNTPPWR